MVTDRAWHPEARREPFDESDGADAGGALASSRGLVLHVQAGGHDPHPWFDRPEVKASSHWWVSFDGELVQYVAADRVAWAQAAGNGAWHSVETEGQPSQPLATAQIEALAVLYRWGHAAWGWPLQLADSPAGTGFGIHSMGGAAWGGHACPGPIRAGQRAAILAAAGGTTTGDDVDVQDLRAELDRATAPGQTSWAGTVVETLETAQHTYNAAAAAASAARTAADGTAAILQALRGNGAPVTLDEVYAVVAALPREQLAALITHCVGLLAGTTGGTA